MAPLTPDLTSEQEQFACGYDPWGDDSDYVTLANHFVTTRKAHSCGICLETIPVGARCRSTREAFERRVRSFYFCPQCSWLMAHRRDDESFDRLMNRYDIGRRVAETARG